MFTSPNIYDILPVTDLEYKIIIKRISPRFQAEVGRLMRKAWEWDFLAKSLCQVCGEEKVDGHHWDYVRMLDVIWLCRKHHQDVHSGKLDEQALIDNRFNPVHKFVLRSELWKREFK